MTTITCDIITPEHSVFSGTADTITLPVYDGQMGVLAGHAPFVAELGTGLVKVTSTDETSGKTTTLAFAVRDGFVQVVDNKVTLLAVVAAAVADLPDADTLDEELTAANATLAEIGSGDTMADAMAQRAWVNARKELLSSVGS